MRLWIEFSGRTRQNGHSSQEFRTFQAEVLAGRPRVECLRRIARRLDVTSVTIFISALVQAEQIGSGMAEVLRSQADDLRQRRRETGHGILDGLAGQAACFHS